MIKIKDLKIQLKDYTPCKFDLYYFDDINQTYIIDCSVFNTINYFDINGYRHRNDGPSYQDSFLVNFYLNGDFNLPYIFAENTNHLICKYCENFCNQECF